MRPPLATAGAGCTGAAPVEAPIAPPAQPATPPVATPTAPAPVAPVARGGTSPRPVLGWPPNPSGGRRKGAGGTRCSRPARKHRPHSRQPAVASWLRNPFAACGRCHAVQQHQSVEHTACPACTCAGACTDICADPVRRKPGMARCRDPQFPLPWQYHRCLTVSPGANQRHRLAPVAPVAPNVSDRPKLPTPRRAQRLA
jgi:hypothetical protein